MVEETGEISFEEADDANIPVDIWLEQDLETNKWKLWANNYMPRKARLSGEASYEALADTREELEDIIKKKIIPLYEVALQKLQAICKRKADNLYYWTL